MCKDPTHGAYKVKAVKWFMYAIAGFLLAFCPTCWRGRFALAAHT